MKLSLSKRILNYARNQYPNWINGGEFERLAMEAKYKASNASRRCREMESGKLSSGKTCPIVLEKEERDSVWYRATAPRETLEYKMEDGTIQLINKWA